MMPPAHARARAGRWGVVIFWCLVLFAVGVMIRAVTPGQFASEATPLSPESASVE